MAADNLIQWTPSRHHMIHGIFIPDSNLSGHEGIPIGGHGGRQGADAAFLCPPLSFQYCGCGFSRENMTHAARTPAMNPNRCPCHDMPG